MALDVIITPASGLVDFQNSGISSATIQLDGSGNLNIAASAGDIQIGDTASDVYIGDGVNNVDIVFEQNGEIRGLTGKTITLGQSDSYISFAGDITSGLNVSGIVTALSFSGNASSATYATYAGIATYATTAGVSTNVSGGTASVSSLTVSGGAYVSGNLGVGVTNPGAKLVLPITGGLASNTLQLGTSNSWASGAEQIYTIGFGDPNTTQMGMGMYGSNRSIWNRYGLAAHVKSDSEFSIKSSNWTNLFGVQGGTGNVYIKGDVGIGTDNPSEKLDVVGTVKATLFSGSGASLTNIPNGALDNSTVSYGGVTLSLGGSDATPAFNLQDATNYPYTSLTGITTSIVGDTTPQLGGDLDLNSNNITGTGNIDITGSLNVSGVSTFQGDVYLGDNDRLRFGDGGDLQILHDGSNSYIQDLGTGQLIIVSDNTIAFKKNGGEQLANFVVDGRVELYYDNSKKFETISTGVTVTNDLYTSGNVSVAGTIFENFNGQLWNVVTQADVGYGASQVPLNQYLGQLAFLDDFSPNGLRRDGGGSDDVSVDTDGNVSIGGSIIVSGIVTATTFSGSGASLTNIPNGALDNSSVSYGGVTLSLGGSDATPAFDLQDATNYPTSSLVGTITNSQLAGSISNDKLVNSTVSYGGVTLSLGGSDATPAFNLADATGLPISTGVSGLGANVATFLATPSSANLRSAVTDETGSGALVFATSPTLVSPTLGNATATTINVTGVSTFQNNVSIAGTVGIGTRIDIVPYDTLSDGTLSFEGSAGQLFSITNNLTSGSIFSVNDVSGIPSIDVDADGTVLIAPYGSTENVGIGTTNPTSKLDVVGDIKTTGDVSANSITAISASFSGNVSIAGTLTYEDVTNVDSLGIITARTGIQVLAGGINVTGVSTFQDNVYLGDNDVLNFGDGNDLRIFSGGNNVFIQETSSTGSLFIDSTNLVLRNGAGDENLARFISNGAVELYYDNSKKFETTGAGVTVFGTTETQQLVVSGVSTFQGNVYLGDNDVLNFGDSNDLRIYHNGSYSLVGDFGTGNLILAGNTSIDLMNPGASEYYARFNNNGAVELYYDNSKKFETTGYGATVYGTLQSQQANVSGIVTASAFYGDGSNLSGIVATNATNVIGGIASITSLNVSGISTLGTLKVSSGIVTATSGIITYYGDGSKLTGLTAQARVVASQTPPTSPTEGDLWYHTTVARLFVYFNDGDSNQWVDASPFNLTGSGGGTNVSVGATAPIAPIIGDLWYNSDYGRLFVYYQDEDSNQWVDAAPFNLPTNNEPAKTENSFIATPGQTTFTVSYEVGFVEVYLNGIRLSSGEFNASSGVSIILNDPATEGDVVDVIEIATGRGPTGPRGSGGPLENVTVATDNNTYYPIFAVGVGTTTPYINTTSGYLNYNPSSGTLNVNQLNVGVTTLGVTTATNLTVQSINCSGVATALDFNSTSDVNLKKDVKVIDDPVAKVLQLNGVSFNWTDTGQSSAGVIAQDVEKVMPEIIRDNPTGYKSLNYNGLIGLLIEAVKEQNETIKSLEQKINTLEERLS